MHERVYVSEYLYWDMNGWTVCKTTDFIIRDQKDHYVINVKYSKNFGKFPWYR